ncbi:MAG: hypothetical protein KDD33_07660 [Bdellovibrionales bacterium]|nr:hypothetical protein [Bdellovibrionales bacterium]
MPNIVFILVFMFASTIAFQNCSATHTTTNLSSECGDQGQCVGSLQDLYPYSTKPSFYEDVQLINKVLDAGEWNYQFIASVVDIDNPDQNIDVEIHLLDGDGKLVCPRTTATVNRSNNHIEIAECKNSAELDVIVAQIKVDNGSGMEVTREIELNLSGL